MSAADRIPWDIRHGTGYLLCADVPFGPARRFCNACHYLGIAPLALESRLRGHANGRGSKLTRYWRQAGIGWTVTRIFEDIDRNEERRLKEKAPMHWCLRCRTERVMAERDPAYGRAIAAAKDRYRATVDAGRRARQAATSRSAGTRAWNKAVATAHEQLQAARHEAAQAWLDAHPKPGLIKVSLACVLDATPVVSPPTRIRQAVLDAAAAASAQAIPDGFLAPGADRRDPDSLHDPADPWGSPLHAAAPAEPQLVAATAMPAGPWGWDGPEPG